MLPPKEIMDKTHDIIQSLNYYFDMSYRRDTVELQCKLDDHTYLEIEVFKDCTKVFIVPKGIYSAAITQILSGTHEIKDLKKIVKKFCEEEF